MNLRLKLALVFTLFCVLLQAQESEKYHVVQVRGDITNLGSGKAINRGDVIHSLDKLQFGNTQSMALVINASGKFKVKLPFQADEQTAMLKSSISPVRSRNQISTRGFADESNDLSDLKAYLGRDQFAIIGDQLSVSLNEEVYPLNPKQFIVFYYNAFNERIAKKLEYDQQKMIITRDKLMNCKGKLLNTDLIENIGVYQYEAETKLSNKITEVNLLFVEENDLKEEFQTIIPVLKNQSKSPEEIRAYLKEYFVDVYGVTDNTVLTSFVDSVLE